MCHVTVWMVLASSELPVFAQHHLFDLAAQHHLFGLVKCPGLDGLENFIGPRHIMQHVWALGRPRILDLLAED
jgi:hypothetical protein